ncbi:MAG: hypothetical protein LIP28_08515 [Deltaproteobacteria bacterium]|nr:hypothetical protein [Deltaproteobacteria bacterium]
MAFTVLHHLLGVCCVLYSFQLLAKLGQDFRGNRLFPGLLGFLGGIIALFLTIACVLGVDYVFPVGSAATDATYFVRLSFLIPLAYLAAFLSSLFVSTLLGRWSVADITFRISYLGVTLIILAPVAHTWYLLARKTLEHFV